MSKNYLTKEQALKIALNTNVPFSSDDTQHIFNTAQIREMMNLAVAAAIGEKVGFLIKHFDGEYELDFNETWQKVKEQLPLYSVKELDN